MMDMIKKIKLFLSVKKLPAFFSLILLMVISAFLEIIGIGMIPIFISVVLDYDLLNNYLTQLNISSLNFILLKTLFWIKKLQERSLKYIDLFLFLVDKASRFLPKTHRNI